MTLVDPRTVMRSWANGLVQRDLTQLFVLECLHSSLQLVAPGDQIMNQVSDVGEILRRVLHARDDALQVVHAEQTRPRAVGSPFPKQLAEVAATPGHAVGHQQRPVARSGPTHPPGTLHQRDSSGRLPGENRSQEGLAASGDERELVDRGVGGEPRSAAGTRLEEVGRCRRGDLVRGAWGNAVAIAGDRHRKQDAPSANCQGVGRHV